MPCPRLPLGREPPGSLAQNDPQHEAGPSEGLIAANKEPPIRACWDRDGNTEKSLAFLRTTSRPDRVAGHGRPCPCRRHRGAHDVMRIVILCVGLESGSDMNLKWVRATSGRTSHGGWSGSGDHRLRARGNGSRHGWVQAACSSCEAGTLAGITPSNGTRAHRSPRQPPDASDRIRSPVALQSAEGGREWVSSTASVIS